MEEKKQELISLLLKLNKLGEDEKEYIKGWLDAKLDKKLGVS